jgi:Tol biopolymer transport system component
MAFGASKAGEPWKLNIISRDGGTPQRVIPGEGPEQAPNWLPDGNSLVFGEVIESGAPAIHLVNLKTHQVSTLPGSTGLFLPRVSPDGRFIVAMTVDSMNLLLFSVASHKWEKLIQGRFINNPVWSRNGQYVSFSDPDEPGTPFYRVRINNHKLERVAVANLLRGLPFGISGRWTGLAPDDSPMLIRDTSIEEIYALTVNWP